MAARKQSRGRRVNPAAVIFLCVAVVLLIGAAFFGVRALNTWSEYQSEAAVTPTPSATVRSVSFTPDPASVTATPDGTPSPSATPSYLAVGSTGSMVTDMQQKLKDLGYYDGAVDGQFGNGTKAAVKLFQTQHNLESDGIAGAKTLTLLNSGNAQRASVTPEPKAVDTLNSAAPMLVNAQNTVESGFKPANLINVKDTLGDLMLYDNSGVMGVREAVTALGKMIEAARRDGITVWKLAEGYRSYSDQLRIFNNRVEQYINEGRTRANAIASTRVLVADAGASEHHTGLAFDLNVPGESFPDTAQSVWLAENCWDYGFIIRYTDEKQPITGIWGEEWHVRYVGLEHAKRIRAMDMCLEEYIEYLKQ